MKAAMLFSCVIATASAACDWEQFALLNSIPIHGEDGDRDSVHVYLGIDGLPYGTVEESLATGDIALNEGEGWHVAPSIAMFPATSDASWSRILRTSPMGGFEYQYYNPRTDEVVHGGLKGLVSHAIPAFESIGLGKPAYYDAFDTYADGYLDTVYNYQATDYAYATALDNLFYILGTRAETTNVVSAYLAEVDAYGHMESQRAVRESFLRLWKRIHQFKKRHPERRFLFTLISDHGMDFIPAEAEHLVDFRDILRNVGITPVDRFSDGIRTKKLFAVPIIHTRVSYVALHTQPSMAEAVAERCSTSNVVDLAFSRAAPPADVQGAQLYHWYAVWRQGKEIVTFGHEAETDIYVLTADSDVDALELGISQPSAGTFWSDEALFVATALGPYPDFFYRVRTGFDAVGVKHPADVLISFRRPYASQGFTMPGGANEVASEGFHGGLDAGSSLGVLMTEEHALPFAVRADNVLNELPVFRSALKRRGVTQVSGALGADLAL